jgi:hypothetical protein
MKTTMSRRNRGPNGDPLRRPPQLCTRLFQCGRRVCKLLRSTPSSARTWEPMARAGPGREGDDLREAVLASFEADGGIPEWLVRSDLLAVDVDEVA